MDINSKISYLFKKVVLRSLSNSPHKVIDSGTSMTVITRDREFIDRHKKIVDKAKENQSVQKVLHVEVGDDVNCDTVTNKTIHTERKIQTDNTSPSYGNNIHNNGNNPSEKMVRKQKNTVIMIATWSVFLMQKNYYKITLLNLCRTIRTGQENTMIY